MCIPEYIMEILDRLPPESYLVGGCVRDSYLGLEPSDYDISTICRPDEIKGSLGNIYKLIDIGEKYGTIKVVTEFGVVDITTFRTEAKYSDGRHPDRVEFGNSIVGDLSRRDFTINAMAYSTSFGLIDPYGGLNDLRCGLIKCVGNPYTRFSEDYLRILRMIVFASRFSFNIDHSTYSDACTLVKGIVNISKERITDCYTKILLCGNASYGIYLLNTVGVNRIVLGIDRLAFNELDNVENDIEVRLARALLEVGNPEVILQNLSLPSKVVNNTLHLVRNYGLVNTGTDRDLRVLSIYIGKHLLSKYDTLIENNTILRQVLSSQYPTELSELAIDGNDLLELGISGTAIGRILQTLLEDCAVIPRFNSRSYLLKRVKSEYNIE